MAKRKIAVLVEGTGAYDECIYVVKAKNDDKALLKIAKEQMEAIEEYTPEIGPCELSEIGGNGTPQRCMAIYNCNGDEVVTMKTVSLQIRN